MERPGEEQFREIRAATSLRAHLPMFVLDVLRWADSFDSIRNVINDHHTVGWQDVWGRPFSPTELDDALADLLKLGLIKPHRNGLPHYYEMTGAGRQAWEAWLPPGEACDFVLTSRALRKWDPIGVFEIDPEWPEDEYESYVPGIVAMLRAGSNADDIAAALQEIRVRHMGLSQDREVDVQVGRELHQAWQRHHGG